LIVRTELRNGPTDSTASMSQQAVAPVVHTLATPLQFPIVKSVLVLLRILDSYIECAAQLQAVGPEVINKTAELLGLFNHRTCQLLLGAGATHMGIKRITSAHLAIASQCVGLVMSQIPVVRYALAARLPKQHHFLLSIFDTLLNDYTNHQREIFAKLVDILRGMTEKACGDLTRGDWPRDDSSQPEVEKSITDICKAATSLHSVLTDYCTVQQRDQVFASIAQMTTQIISKYFSRIDMTKKSHARVVGSNVAHIIQRLRSLAGVDSTACKELEVFVQR